MKYLLEYGLYLGLLIATVWLTSKILGITPAKHKYAALDGLRGICAALVAVFHLYWRAGGESDVYWSLDYITISHIKKSIYLTGELSVGIFFMLSAFLFFKKALASDFNVKDFAISRFMRIYPPVVAILFIVYFATLLMHPDEHTPVWEWFLPSLPFLFNPPGANINGFSLQIATSGVFWTLVWELRLYFAIPLLYLIMKKIKYKEAFIISLMLMVLCYKYLVASEQYLSFIMYFLSGFLAATIKYDKKPSDVICLVLLLAALFFTKHAYNTTTPLYMFIVFFTIKCGCDYFGLLTSLPIKMLGTCSFSIYLVHGIAQTVSKHYLYNSGYYAWQICAIIATGIMAPLLYKYVESRSIRHTIRKVRLVN
ncbi:acyltransferase [uncultured Citrobacter sp.]|uniref:acyltransferase family protein n=1 Tax=uncultured Citrobacter sp. TaxID=200446 RepID=UPI00259A3949|nr:acyltransferase [uncultured Citrobacter sp.]